MSVVVLHASVIELHTIDLPEAEAPGQKRMLFSAFRIEVENYEGVYRMRQCLAK